MTVLKNTLSALIIAAVIMPALNSCKKVSPKKLDGSWNVTSGESKNVYKEDGETVTTTTSFDGSVETRTTTHSDCALCGSESIGDKTVEYSFDKKAGTYTIITVSTTSYKDEDMPYYIKNGDGDCVIGGSMDRRTETVSTKTEEGAFSITGGTGEIKKNSQIVLVSGSWTDQYTSTYKYFEAGTSTALDVSDKYDGEYNYATFDYVCNEKLPASKSGTSSDKGESFDAIIYNVDELKKGVMNVSISSSSNYTSGANESTSTFEGTMVMEEQ